VTHRIAALATATALVAAVACSSRLPSRPEVFTQTREVIAPAGRALHLDLVKPRAATREGVLIFFATGDAGWADVSKAVFRHLAEDGYAIAAYDSREALRHLKRSRAKLTFPQTAKVIGAALAEAKAKLGLPDTTPVILVGNSRGAGMVVFGAGEPSLQATIAGAVAIALTRESDYLQAPEAADRPPSIEVDDRGGVLTYPALDRLGSIKIAVLQSTGDSYVPAAEARTLFGPDTATRRLYAIQARNHGFGGGQEQLFRDLDAALAWIDGAPSR